MVQSLYLFNHNQHHWRVELDIIQDIYQWELTLLHQNMNDKSNKANTQHSNAKMYIVFTLETQMGKTNIWMACLASILDKLYSYNVVFRLSRPFINLHSKNAN